MEGLEQDENILDNNFVIELLESWGVSEETLKVFKEHELDLFCIENITEADINELIPPKRIKDRIKFKAGLSRLQKENKALSTLPIDTISNASNDSDEVKSNSSGLSGRYSKTKQTSTNAGLICLQALNKKLDTTHRNQLTKSIVDYFIKEYGSMNAQDYDDIADKIIELFPSENKETYYIPSRKYGKKSYIPARGKLVDRYHNQRRLLRKSGLIDDKRTPYTTATPTVVIVEEPEISLEDENSIKLWLKFNKEPWVEIKQKWKLSHRLRSQDLKCNNNSIQDICNEWPSLKSSLGYNLVESDFDVLFPNCELKLFKKWPHFMEKSLLVYKKLTACEETLKILADNPGEDVRDYVYLKLMSRKMPPTIKVALKGDGKKKIFYKPSIAESENSFILHVMNQSEILTQTKLRQDERLAKGLTCQPLIVAVGPSIEEITDFYVHFETVIYKIDTLLKAVDVCFKLIHVFNAEYPLESVNVWTFIQKYFYEIDCRTDKKISNVASFISDLS